MVRDKALENKYAANWIAQAEHPEPHVGRRVTVKPAPACVGRPGAAFAAEFRYVGWCCNPKETKMPDEIKSIPYREGEPSPGPDYILVQMTDDSGQDLGTCWVRPEDLENAPVRRGNVEPLLPMLRWVWRHLSQHITWCRTFEDWELGFIRDEHPGAEAATWVRQTYAYLEYLHKHPNANKAVVISAIIAIGSGQEPAVEPASVAQTLRRLVANPPSVLDNVENFTKDGRLKTKEKHLR
jgi:hypothetical protein